MIFQIFPSQSLPFNHFIKMLQKRTVSAAHIQNSFRLLTNWSVENVDDKLVNHLEISQMRAATSPDIHFAIHVDFVFAIFNFPDFGCFSKNKAFYF